MFNPLTMYISAQHKITTLIKLRISEKDEIITTMQNFVSVLIEQKLLNSTIY